MWGKVVSACVLALLFGLGWLLPSAFEEAENEPARLPAVAEVPTPDPRPSRFTERDGIYSVGNCYGCIEPGRWRTLGPADAACRWNLRDDLEMDSEVVDKGKPPNSRVPQVTVTDGQYFTTSSCGPWERIG